MDARKQFPSDLGDALDEEFPRCELEINPNWCNAEENCLGGGFEIKDNHFDANVYAASHVKRENEGQAEIFSKVCSLL